MLTSTWVPTSHFCRAWELIFSLYYKSWNLQPSVQCLCMIGLMCSAEPPVRQTETERFHKKYFAVNELQFTYK